MLKLPRHLAGATAHRPGLMGANAPGFWRPSCSGPNGWVRCGREARPRCHRFRGLPRTTGERGGGARGHSGRGAAAASGARAAKAAVFNGTLLDGNLRRLPGLQRSCRNELTSGTSSRAKSAAGGRWGRSRSNFGFVPKVPRTPLPYRAWAYGFTIKGVCIVCFEPPFFLERAHRPHLVWELADCRRDLTLACTLPQSSDYVKLESNN